MIHSSILDEDLEYIWERLTPLEKAKLHDSTIVITGCAGFLGLCLMHFFVMYADRLGIRTVIGIDSFVLGKPKWMERLTEAYPDKVDIHHCDISKEESLKIGRLKEADFIIHMASIASPVFYRKHPLETIDANVWGLRKVLDLAADKQLRGLLFFSSSEIYGDPQPENIPTPEHYRGNVASIGPRACYDEAKRFGETLCYVYAEKYQAPITVVRPFNNYGPGMKLGDQRIPADLAKAVMENRDIVLFSDGTPTRTFCYVSDACVGYIKALVYGRFDVFNIGNDKPEISMAELARLYLQAGKETSGYTGEIKFQRHAETQYLTDNPSRRCPNLTKARSSLGFHPTIEVKSGIKRFLRYLIQSGEKAI